MLRWVSNACGSTLTSFANQQLSCLHADCTHIGNEGSKAMGESLKFNRILTSINFEVLQHWRRGLQGNRRGSQK